MENFLCIGNITNSVALTKNSKFGYKGGAKLLTGSVNNQVLRA